MVKKIYEEVDDVARSVLVGSLLGDGYLRIGGRCINASYSEQHCIEQSDYLLWKSVLLKSLNPTFKKINRVDKRTGRKFMVSNLTTSANPFLTRYYYKFYSNNGKKLFTKEIFQEVDLLSLSIWYCDDGFFNYSGKCCGIGGFFSECEVAPIKEYFGGELGLCTKFDVIKDNHFNLRFTVSETIKFLNLIEKHVPECMSYKLGMFRECNSKRLHEGRLNVNKINRESYRRMRKNLIRKEEFKKKKREYYQKNKDKINKQKRDKRKRNKVLKGDE